MLLLQRLAGRPRSCTCFAQVVVRLDQEPARAAGRVEHGFAKPGIGDLDHEPDDRPRRVELARIAGRIPHLPQHRLVQRAERVDLLGRSEVDAVDLVDDVAQQVTADHAVVDAPEDGGDHVAPVVAVGAGAALRRYANRPGPRLAIGPGASSWLMKASSSSPVMPCRWRPNPASGRAARWPGGTSSRRVWPPPRAVSPGHPGTSGT